MPSSSTSMCFNCRKAWKTGGICGCSNPDIEYMGKRWRAPKKTNDSAWKWMRKRRDAGMQWYQWALWDQQGIDPRLQSIPADIYERRYQDAQRRKEWRKKAKEIGDSHRAIFYADLRKIVEDRIAKHKEIRKKINARRRRLDKAGAD